MIILATTTKSLLAIDIVNEVSYTLHQGKGLYYGIAFNENHIFVGARNNNNNEATTEEDRQQETGSILVFDHDLNLTDEIISPFAMRDIHQVYYLDGKLFIACSFDNMVAIYDFQKWEKWYPLEKHNEDYYHFNSINSYNNVLMVLAHNWNREPSQILFFDKNNLKFLDEIKLGYQAHNIWLEGKHLFTCDSANNQIINTNGFQKNADGFLRGASILDDFKIIGSTELIIERQDRIYAGSEIYLFDKFWKGIKKISIKNEGQILEIRCPGSSDMNYNSSIGKIIRIDAENIEINRNVTFMEFEDDISDNNEEKNTNDIELLEKLNYHIQIEKIKNKKEFNVEDFYFAKGKYFVKTVFRLIFNRECSDDELKFYSDELKFGRITKLMLIKNFLKNKNAKNVIVKDLMIRYYFHRLSKMKFLEKLLEKIADKIGINYISYKAEYKGTMKEFELIH